MQNFVHHYSYNTIRTSVMKLPSFCCTTASTTELKWSLVEGSVIKSLSFACLLAKGMLSLIIEISVETTSGFRITPNNLLLA